MESRIEMLVNPGAEVLAAILKPLLVHNLSQAGDPKPEICSLVIRDHQTNEIIGGIIGEIFYDWLFVELLAIPKEVRGQGIGSRLLRMAEDVAREKGCLGIWLNTFDFQAPSFYEKHGFTEFGRLNDFPLGHKRFFLQKRLS